MFQMFHLSLGMLRVLHLDILKVNRVLHVLQCDSLAVAAGGVTRGLAGRRCCVESGGGADALRVRRYVEFKPRNGVQTRTSVRIWSVSTADPI
jgi:hypothetical protein